MNKREVLLKVLSTTVLVVVGLIVVSCLSLPIIVNVLYNTEFLTLEELIAINLTYLSFGAVLFLVSINGGVDRIYTLLRRRGN